MRPTTNRLAVAGSTRRWLAVFLAALVGFGCVSALWAVTTPLSASPDEPAHLIKAASVVRGELLGDVTDGLPQIRDVDVPAGVAYSAEADCARFQPEVTADCAPGFPSDADAIVEEPTSAGLYNPVYYVLVGWPTLVLDGSKASLYAMRLVSALVCSVFFAAAVASLSRLPRPVLPVLAAFGALTPTTYFLSGVVNPNAFEAATAAAFAATLVSGLLSGRPVGWGQGLLLALSGGLLVHARGLSPLWLAVIVVVAAVLVGWRAFWEHVRRPQVLAAVLAVAVSSVLAVIWTLKSGSLGAVGLYPGAGTSFQGGLVRMLERTFDFGQELIGKFGWLDTPVPSYVVFAYFVGVGGLVLAAVLVPTSGRVKAAVLLSLASYVLIPALVQAASVTRSGYVWQGRYNLPVYVLLVLVAAVALAPSFDRLSSTLRRRVVLLVVVVHSAAAFVALMTFLRRNAVGLSASWVALLETPAWRPPVLSTSVWTGLIAAGCLVLGVAFLVVLALSRRQAVLSSCGDGSGDAGDVEAPELVNEQGERHEPVGEAGGRRRTTPDSPSGQDPVGTRP
ncbi:DUF2142 domain-containing protein [Frigoribacterium sp. CFBP 13729]|uniref:DUF2142 domain-containing protein n=1 Tax=Frigoribacterium sp. CFBP 13729 TaxID=2775293 RepID=UPI00177F9E46|nr:DUF2142 domain-containing protein [Frigoribacterium sp. CFBP 13729]MBD8609695.1 DUF2142 domain-containing protein [Frigoribacterium sp. CFBP 13729]